MNNKPIVIKGLKNNESRNIMIDGKTPDKITVKCSNDNFYASVVKNNISIQKYMSAAVAIVHDGYFYDKEKEYFMYQRENKEVIDTAKNIEYHRVQRVADTIRTRQGASNYVLDTKIINGDHYEPTCKIDCINDKERIQIAYKMQYITACDSYQMWNDFNMSISIKNGFNGNGLYFKPDNKYSYAYINITPYIKENTVLNFIADETIQAYVMEEILTYDNSMARSSFAKIKAACTRKQKEAFYRFQDIAVNHRYYLLISGSGMIDDIIIRDFDSENFHRKNIDVLGIKIEEFALKNYEARLQFDPENTSFNGLEIRKDGCIETGAPVDWGATLIARLQDTFDSFLTDSVDLRKGAFYSRYTRGKIMSPWIEVDSYKSIETLSVKINNMMIDVFQFFDIHLYTAEDPTGYNAREIAFDKKTNLLELKPTYLLRYIRVSIEMPAERVINSIEIYGGYSEKTTGQALRIPPTSNGILVTKIYNTVARGSYRLKNIDCMVKNPEDLRVWIRGYRKDQEHAVWTDWYLCNFDESMISESPHTFEDYQYFQFKIALLSVDAAIKINNFILEAV